MDNEQLIADLLEQQASIGLQMDRQDPTKSVDTRTFLHLREAHFALEKALYHLKTAYV